MAFHCSHDAKEIKTPSVQFLKAIGLLIELERQQEGL